MDKIKEDQIKWYHEEYSKSPSLQDFAVKIGIYYGVGLRETLLIIEPRWQKRLMDKKYD